MAKDPAFLFYPNDWIGGTLGMTFEEKGAYLQLLILQFNKGKFNKEQAKRTLNVCFDAVWPTLELQFICEGGLYHNERLAEEKEKREKYTESRRNSRLKADEDAVKIYLIKDLDTGYYKIGSSVNPLRRFSEMKNQKNPAITFSTRNYELLFVSIIVKRTVEKVLHQKFKTKRILGEWFSLSESDISYITTQYGDETYVTRTAQRTEDENENINENVLKGGMGGEHDGLCYDIEKYLASRQKEFEAVCMNCKKNPDEVKEILNNYHLWNVQNEIYPKKPLPLIAGFQRWVLNEKKFKKNGTHSKETGTIGKTIEFDKL